MFGQGGRPASIILGPHRPLYHYPIVLLVRLVYLVDANGFLMILLLL